MAFAKTRSSERWLVASYSRLSNEDSEDRGESNSISNQKILISQYIKSHKDMELVCEYADDGYSGSNFDRPGFKNMIEAIEAGAINCIVVKDLSRFGRNYIGVGHYLERVFPERGIRLIAINDNYDGINADNYTDSLIVPIKNLVNDNYCATTSAKTKAHLDIKRSNGEFVSNYAPYGYAKDPKNKNQLVVDEEAAQIVRQIFDWRLEGLSTISISNRLNSLGVLCPIEYKNSIGINQNAPFKTSLHAKWSSQQIIRILANEIYTGKLIQGKTYKPSFRSKQHLPRPEKDWFVTEDAHEAIIDKRTFELAKDIALRDTKATVDGRPVYLLSGFVFCADCKNSMVMSSTVRGKNRFSYYRCSTNRSNKHACAPHSIRVEKLEEVVSESVLRTLQSLANISKTKKSFSPSVSYEKKMADFKEKRAYALAEGSRAANMGHQLYDDFKRGIISQAEMTEFQAAYDAQALRYEQQVEVLDAEIAALEKAGNKDPWLSAIRRFDGAKVLTRRMLVEFVNRIEIDQSGAIEIEYRFADAFDLGSEVGKDED